MAALKRARSLVVQRAGWKKFVVYFLATKLLKEPGSSPKRQSSPLLSLSRKQNCLVPNSVLAAPPTGFALGALGRRSLRVTNQQLAAGQFEAHAEFVVAQKAVGWVLGEDF